jgi:hypothetical protein
MGESISIVSDNVTAGAADDRRSFPISQQSAALTRRASNNAGTHSMEIHDTSVATKRRNPFAKVRHLPPSGATGELFNL